MSDSKHTHKDGWTSDETFRSMRRNCGEYKKKDIELIKFREENAKLKEEITKLKEENPKFKEENLKSENTTKNLHFASTFDNMFKEYTSDTKSSSNIYKHRCDMKKKILNNAPDVRENGRVDYELILFRRVMELESQYVNE